MKAPWCQGDAWLPESLIRSPGNPY